MTKVPAVKQSVLFPPWWLVLENIHKCTQALSYYDVILNCFYFNLCILYISAGLLAQDGWR